MAHAFRNTISQQIKMNEKSQRFFRETTYRLWAAEWKSMKEMRLKTHGQEVSDIWKIFCFADFWTCKQSSGKWHTQPTKASTVDTIAIIKNSLSNRAPPSLSMLLLFINATQQNTSNVVCTTNHNNIASLKTTMTQINAQNHTHRNTETHTEKYTQRNIYTHTYTHTQRKAESENPVATKSSACTQCTCKRGAKETQPFLPRPDQWQNRYSAQDRQTWITNTTRWRKINPKH